MRRSLFRIHLQSIAKSFRQSKRPNTVADNTQIFRACTTSAGYGRVSVTRAAQVQIVNALRGGERSRASTLLLDLCSGNRSLRADDFLCILQHCSRAPDPLFVMETWRIMGEHEVHINEKSYLLIIRALCKGGYLVEAFNLINFLGENHEIYPILPMYNNFLGACARMNGLNHANECLDSMERKLMGKNEVTHAELLKLAVLQKNLSAVHGIWKEYITNYSPSIISLRKFVWAFTSLSDLESAYEILQRMVALALRGGFIITKTTEGKLYTSRLDIPIPSNNYLSLKRCTQENRSAEISLLSNCKEMDPRTSSSGQCDVLAMGRKEVDSFGPSMQKKQLNVPVMKLLRWAFSDVIRGCAQTRNCRLAEQLILQMQSLGMELSCNTYDGFIRAIVSEKGFHEGLEMLKVMQEKNLKPYDSTLATISIGCSKSLELNLAEGLLGQISKSSSVYPYNAFLEACDRLDQPERAVPILARMKQMKLHPDIRTYELLFSLFGNVNAPYEVGNLLSQVEVAKRIRTIELDMEKYGIQHSLLSIKNLLKALGAEGMIKEMIQYLRMAENQFSLRDSYLGTLIYNTVLHSLVEAKECHSAVEIFRNMKLCGFVPNAATYTIMIDCCSIVRCFKTACALVSMMVRDGFHLEAATYTTLLKILLEIEDFNEALNLLDQGNLEGIQADVLLFNTILQKACEKGRIDIIEVVIERMHQEKIQPDPSTCSYVFSAYVDGGFESTAVEALQVLSTRMISEDDITLEEKRMEYEDAFVLAEDLEAESRIMELFKDSKENTAVALLNLRWCAIAGFPISWSPNQSFWAKRLSSSSVSRE